MKAEEVEEDGKLVQRPLFSCTRSHSQTDLGLAGGRQTPQHG
jgi:hypothetical protein